MKVTKVSPCSKEWNLILPWGRTLCPKGPAKMKTVPGRQNLKSLLLTPWFKCIHQIGSSRDWHFWEIRQGKCSSNHLANSFYTPS